jgi:hypothetical protein
LLAVGGRVASGADGRARGTLAIGVAGGFVLLAVGYTGAWTYSSNAGGELGLWHNEWTPGRLGLVLSLAAVAGAATSLATGRGPHAALVGGALVGLGIQVALHFGYLVALTAWYAELDGKAGAAIGLAAGALLATVGALVLRGAPQLAARVDGERGDA